MLRSLAMAVVAGCVIFHRRQLLLRERERERESRAFHPSPSSSGGPLHRLPIPGHLHPSLFVLRVRSSSPLAPANVLDTPLDTSCTILDLPISPSRSAPTHGGRCMRRAGCTGRARESFLQSRVARDELAYTHASHALTKSHIY